MTKKARKKTAGVLTAGLAMLVAGAMGTTALSNSLTAFAAELSANGKYYSSYNSYADLLEAVGEVNTQTAEEGQVLLKNDGTLPLTGRERLSVFGVASSTTVAGPTSNSAFKTHTGFTVSDRGPIYDGLKEAGFKVNPTLADYYADKGFSNSDIGKETTDFDSSVKNSLGLYDDVGVIVLSRYGGEGSDLALITGEENDGMYGERQSGYEHDALYKGEYAAKENSGGGGMGMGQTAYDVAETSENYDAEGTEYKHYLQLTDSEEALIDYVADHCKKIVVVLNTSNPMECYDLREDARVNGILLMGRGGETGHLAVGEILAGLVSPSGKLVDEWNTDFTADPTWNNYAWNDQTGSQNMYYNGTYGTGMTEYTGNGDYDDYLTRGSTAITYGSHNQSGYYGTDYEEDIYLGYAYWETLYYEIYNGLLKEETVTYKGNGITKTVTRAGYEGTAQEAAAAAANDWWKKNVTFAFGWGLSYTTFSFNIDEKGIIATGDALKSEDEKVFEGFDISKDMTKANLDSSEGKAAKVKTLFIPVTVTNTGNVTGKEVVEIYITAPYNTDSAKLEKSFVQLAGFGKTDELRPGDSQTIYVQVNVQDMASFDYNDAYGTKDVTGYTLDSGEYAIRAMNTSHYDVATDVADTEDAYDEVKFTLAAGETAGAGAARLLLDDFSGNLCGAIFSESYDETDKVNGHTWAEDTDEDHYIVYNSLRTSNLMADGTSEEVLLSRSTILNYFPEAPDQGDLVFDTTYINHLDYWNQFSAADTESDEWYFTKAEADAEGWKQGTGVLDAVTGTYSIVLSDMSGVELFDADGTLTDKWNTFMNQLTVDEMTTLIRKNGNMWRSTGLDSIGKAANQQKDSYNNNGDTFLWVDAPTITATWNTEIAYDIGQVRGNLSLYNGWSAWGGPEMDTHRSPFSGRNYEYLSQDGIVGGYIAAGLTGGMEAMGVTCYVKHFALNDQETCRDGMENMVWLSEQSARQIYFKVFQMAMQEGGSSSSMTGFARFCGVPTSSNNRLMEGMVVDQWGWNGFFITDGYSGFSRCTTMASMMRSFVVPLPLNGKIPAISGEYDSETGKFTAYTGAWDTELTYNDTEGNPIETPMYNDRGEAAGTAKGYYVGTETENYTQWYYMRMLAARILYIESNALTNLNGHSLTTLPTLGEEDLTFTQGEEISASFGLSGEAKSCYTLDKETGEKTKLYDTEYTVEGELPAGVTFNASEGTLSGTPTEAGEYKVKISVTIDGWVNTTLVNDDKKSTNENLTKEYTIKVNSGFYLEDANDKEIEALDVKAGNSFAAYIKSDTVTAGTNETLKYTVKSGSLPSGLELNAEEGTISGTIAADAKDGAYEVMINIAKSSSSSGGGQGGFPGGWGGQGGGSSTTNYTYKLTFNVTGGQGEVEVPASLTKAEVEEMINNALGGVISEDRVKELIAEATSSGTTLTESKVQEMIDAAIAAIPGDGGCSSALSGKTVVVSMLVVAAAVGVIFAAKRKKREDK